MSYDDKADLKLSTPPQVAGTASGAMTSEEADVVTTTTQLPTAVRIVEEQTRTERSLSLTRLSQQLTEGDFDRAGKKSLEGVASGEAVRTRNKPPARPPKPQRPDSDAKKKPLRSRSIKGNVTLSVPQLQNAKTSSEEWLKQMTFKDELRQHAKEEAKVRTRIRSRLVVEGSDWSRQELENVYANDTTGKPLITAADVQTIRQEAWVPNEGNFKPAPSELTLGYDTAWDIGKRGCVAYKFTGEYDLRIGPNKLRFFIMDGTDRDSFLTYYTKPDALVERGQLSEKKGIICAADMKNGIWDYEKKKIKITMSDAQKKGTRVLEDFPASFFDAMLVCIREMEVNERTEELKKGRLKERRSEKWEEYLRRRRLRDVSPGGGGGRRSHSVSDQQRHSVYNFDLLREERHVTQNPRKASLMGFTPSLILPQSGYDDNSSSGSEH
eukprot:Lankesteria_metandrocarpae@DN1336_c0_g1_i1.p2